ncbi:SDR family NAD(P)-dependent oxidoreductase [Xanthobacter pseudotagetidis]|uniref:SDR family NAD(P)-dependent oxidoreductase n=1 Tax=Xanthobacter pseudotagetidis TaxID=3119911 RepID=UPI0037286423
MATQRFKDRVALVTGGARGIGFAAAERIASEGGRLALADIDAKAAEAAAAKLPGAIGIGCDITKADDVAAMVATAEGALGPLSIFVNSAAVLDDKLFLESTPADWKRMLGVCLDGPMLGLHAVLPGMVARGYGRVVCLASDSARIGQARLSYYAAAKAGVIALVKSVAQEVGGKGVTLNVVSPGATNTPLRQAREAQMLEQMGEEKYARRQKSVLKLYPTGRIGEPEDIGAAIAFLASGEAGWITGQVLSVNGGFVMP